MITQLRSLPAGGLYIYYFIVFIILVWLLSRYKRNEIACIIILLFFYGFFANLHSFADNIYKVIVFSWVVFSALKRNIFQKLSSKLKLSLNLFFIYIIFFSISSIILNNDSILIAFSQLSKLIIPFILLLIMRLLFGKNELNITKYNKLFFTLLIVQIGFNVLKLFIFRAPWEGLVGSITPVNGGGVGTGLPLVGLCWFALNTNMKMEKWYSILFLVGLLFIGFMTGKRAVWLLFPVFFLLFSMFVAKKKYPKQFLYILMLTPLFFYLGFRISPTLNPEQKVWGSFDSEYAWNYIMDYSMGKEDKSGNRGEGKGRVGANMVLWNMISDTDSYTDDTLFGQGCTRIYAADNSKYRDTAYNFGVNSRGSLTGVFMLFIAIGLIGLILFLLLFISLFQQIKYKRLSWVLLGMALFDFVFYNATIVREPALIVLIFYMILYSNIQYDENGNFIGQQFSLKTNLKRFRKLT